MTPAGTPTETPVRSAPAAAEDPAPLLRTLPFRPGTFFDAWTRKPERFADLLPDPFAAGAYPGIGTPRPPDAARAAAAGVIGTTNRVWGADPAVLASAERLRDPQTLAVVTGQQPGLFGGPFYSLIKAMSTVAAARELEARTGQPVVPVFWIEGDDHDFEEIRGAWLLDRSGSPQTLRYEPEDEHVGLPAFRRVLDDSILDLHGQLPDILPETEYTEGLLLAARDCYAPGRSLSEAFGRLLLHLTRGSGLVVMDPTRPELKRLAFPVYEAAVRHEAAGRRQIAARTREIEAMGFHGQAAAEGYGVFCTGPTGARARVRTDAAGAPPEGVLDGCVERLSAAVLLRPLVQDFLLPTAIYVGGPSEIAYHAQMGDLYGLHGISRPFVIPRHQVAILTKSQLRVLDQDGIGFDELSAGDEAALNRRAADPAAQAAFAQANEAMDSSLEAVEQAAGAVDQSLTAAVRRARGKVHAILADLEAKSVRAAKRRDEERRQRFLRARNALFPGGAPQERRLSPLVFANRYGPHFGAWLLAAFEDPAADRRARNLLVR
ncbi:MAG: bacillithiol biosynthesis BshC [Acidobacteria bacterium]|nr:bacillithiol biosynthesis BshC [Acidobacteriota bacterium]MYG75898.1 bacillithiol biosynthesis BshC [Acidobacteriota bacterium]